jgi:hypothetical protein
MLEMLVLFNGVNVVNSIAIQFKINVFNNTYDDNVWLNICIE